MSRFIRNAALALVASFAVAAQPALAQRTAYPDKPIRLIIPFAPGGGIDVIGRLIAQRLTSDFGQSVIVDNRAGAGGKIGIETALAAAPDGYTMLFISGGYTANAAIYKLPYNPIADVTPVAMIGESGYTIALNPAVPAKSVQELIALAKAKPGALNYGTSGVGGLTHLATELFDLMAGTKMTHVAYKGSGPAVTALLGGQIQVSFAAVPAVIAHVKAGRLRIIGVTTPKRIAAVPDVPAIAEALPGYETILWYGILGPKKLPSPVVTKWSGVIAAALQAPEFKQRMAVEGFEVGESSAARLDAVMKRDIAKWTRVVSQAGIKVTE